MIDNQIEGWIEVSASGDWQPLWDESFDQLGAQIHTPGGVTWIDVEVATPRPCPTTRPASCRCGCPAVIRARSRPPSIPAWEPVGFDPDDVDSSCTVERVILGDEEASRVARPHRVRRRRPSRASGATIGSWHQSLQAPIVARASTDVCLGRRRDREGSSGMDDYYDLGSFTRTVTTELGRRPALVRSGHQLAVRLQPRRGGRLFPEGDRGRPRLRHGPLGRRDRRRAELQPSVAPDGRAHPQPQPGRRLRRDPGGFCPRPIGSRPVEADLIGALHARYPQRDLEEDMMPWNLDVHRGDARRPAEPTPTMPTCSPCSPTRCSTRRPWQMWDLETGGPKEPAKTVEARGRAREVASTTSPTHGTTPACSTCTCT